MELTDAEWGVLIQTLGSQAQVIQSWPADDPNPDALRCEFSRHRTLAHLRAAQETWLEAVLLFAAKDYPRIVRPHPWRLFTDKGYDSLSWEEHRTAFLTDRSSWLALVRRPDLNRDRGGKLSGKVHTIETLTKRLVDHESHHISLLR